MDISNKPVNMSNQPFSFWTEIWVFVKDNTLQAGIFTLVWKGIDKTFKYFSESRDAELRRIVKEEVKPDITNLTTAIDELREAIWELKKK